MTKILNDTSLELFENESAILVLGSINLRYGEGNQYPDRLATIKLHSDSYEFGKNTFILYLECDFIKCEYYTNKGTEVISHQKLREVINGSSVTSNFSNLYTASDFSPLFVFVKSKQTFRFFWSTLFYEKKIVFINPSPKDVAGQLPSTISINDIVQLSISQLNKSRLAINNHNNFSDILTKYLPEKELEYKLNLPEDTDIWTVAQRFQSLLALRTWGKWIPHVRSPFSNWEFDNYLFEVVQPEHQKGYISFIPRFDGTFIIKHKIYSTDQFSRIERRFRNITVVGSFEEYIREHFGSMTIKPFPPFRRLRFDIDFESIESGNHLSIMVDRCHIRGSPEKILCQCEIEYIDSRTIDVPSGVEDDMSIIYELVKTHLKEMNIDFIETFYSKLSWLQDYSDHS